MGDKLVQKHGNNLEGSCTALSGGGGGVDDTGAVHAGLSHVGAGGRGAAHAHACMYPY